MMVSSRSLAAALMLVASSAACSGSDPAPDGGVTLGDASNPAQDATADAGTTPGLDAAPPGADAEPVSPDAAPEGDAGFDLTRDPACPQSAAYIVLYNGRVVDQAGQGIAGAKAQMCIHTAPRDGFYCIQPADTRADGTFTVVVPEDVRCMRDSTMRFLVPRTSRGATYCKIPLASATPETTSTVAFSMFDTRAPRTLPPRGDENAARTVVFDDGLELDITPFSFFGTYDNLAGARVPLDHPGLCFLEGQAPFDGLYVFSPEGDFDGRVPLRIPNTTGLAPGRRVRGSVLGSLGCMLENMYLVPEAEWAEFGAGEVSADGRTITITPGLPCLSWFGYRAE